MKVIDKILAGLLALILVLMVLTCAWQIFTRFVLNDASKYTEELVRYLLIWLTMLGVPYTYGQNRHLVINFITHMFSEQGKKVNALCVDLLVSALTFFVMVIGGLMVTQNAADQTSPAMGMPMELYYMCLPLGGILLLFYSIPRIIDELKNLKEGK
ncbi:MAG: TRAP transporter small permease [Succinivibrio sp.]|nr:TRAP transporter small permease [Succinivibrio sp.]